MLDCRSALVVGFFCAFLGGMVFSVATAGEPTFSANMSNTYSFDAVSVRFVRVVVSRTNRGAVCLDELEVYGPDSSGNLAVRAGRVRVDRGSRPSADPAYLRGATGTAGTAAEGRYARIPTGMRRAGGPRRCRAQSGRASVDDEGVALLTPRNYPALREDLLPGWGLYGRALR